MTLEGVLRGLLDATWGAKADPTPRLAALRGVAQRVMLDALMDLDANPAASSEVRAVVTAGFVGLCSDLEVRFSPDLVTRAHQVLALRDVSEFLDDPALRKSRPARLPPPPGRPIG